MNQQFGDILGVNIPIPLQGRFYPLGFSLDIATNAQVVIQAAAQGWGEELCAFDRPPMQIEVIVRAGKRESGDAGLASKRSESGPVPEPAFRSRGGSLAIVSDQDHFAVCDPGRRFAWCMVSEEFANDFAQFRWHFLEPMAYVLLSHEDIVAVHAACVERAGRGILLCGASGAGKSTLAFACARAGWNYVSDEATIFLQRSGVREVLGKPHRFRFRAAGAGLFPELRTFQPHVRANGRSTVEVPTSSLNGITSAARARIECVVFLDRRENGPVEPRRLGTAELIERMLRDLPDYGAEVRRRHEETLRQLGAVPGYELQYKECGEAVRWLNQWIDP